MLKEICFALLGVCLSVPATAQTIDPLTLRERPRAISPLEEPGAVPRALDQSIQPFGSERATQAIDRASGRIEDSLPWGLSDSQILRLCFSGETVREIGVSDIVVTIIRFVDVADLSEVNGSRTLAVTQVRTPVNETKCTNVSYLDLVDAGIEPNQATNSLQFELQLLRPSPANKTDLGADLDPEDTVVFDDAIEIGTAMNIDAETGKIELYERMSGRPEILRRDLTLLTN